MSISKLNHTMDVTLGVLFKGDDFTFLREKLSEPQLEVVYRQACWMAKEMVTLAKTEVAPDRVISFLEKEIDDSDERRNRDDQKTKFINDLLDNCMDEPEGGDHE